MEDHGKGFDVAASGERRGSDLVAMRERAEFLGGSIDFSQPAAAARSFACACPEKGRIRMPNKISVLLVDDHRLVRRGFRRMLEDEPDITVVGEASDGDEAIRLARSFGRK